MSCRLSLSNFGKRKENSIVRLRYLIILFKDLYESDLNVFGVTCAAKEAVHAISGLVLTIHAILARTDLKSSNVAVPGKRTSFEM